MSYVVGISTTQEALTADRDSSSGGSFGIKTACSYTRQGRFNGERGRGRGRWGKRERVAFWKDATTENTVRKESGMGFWSVRVVPCRRFCSTCTPFRYGSHTFQRDSVTCRITFAIFGLSPPLLFWFCCRKSAPHFFPHHSCSRFFRTGSAENPYIL